MSCKREREAELRKWAISFFDNYLASGARPQSWYTIVYGSTFCDVNNQACISVPRLFLYGRGEKGEGLCQQSSLIPRARQRGYMQTRNGSAMNWRYDAYLLATVHCGSLSVLHVVLGLVGSDLLTAMTCAKVISSSSTMISCLSSPPPAPSCPLNYSTTLCGVGFCPMIRFWKVPKLENVRWHPPIPHLHSYKVILSAS